MKKNRHVRLWPRQIYPPGTSAPERWVRPTEVFIVREELLSLPFRLSNRLGVLKFDLSSDILVVQPPDFSFFFYPRQRHGSK